MTPSSITSAEWLPSVRDEVSAALVSNEGLFFVDDESEDEGGEEKQISELRDVPTHLRSYLVQPSQKIIKVENWNEFDSCMRSLIDHYLFPSVNGTPRGH